jgi:hypothetical protein
MLLLILLLLLLLPLLLWLLEGLKLLLLLVLLYSFSNGVQLCCQRGALVGSNDGGGCGALSH